MNVVMITEKQDTVARYSCLNSGVFVITLQVQTGRRPSSFYSKQIYSSWMYGELFILEVQQETRAQRLLAIPCLRCRLPAWQDYLRDFWPDLQAAQELHGSICQALQEKESEDSQKEFSEHLPAEVLEAGIKSGRYLKVQGWPSREGSTCLAFHWSSFSTVVVDSSTKELLNEQC